MPVAHRKSLVAKILLGLCLCHPAAALVVDPPLPVADYDFTGWLGDAAGNGATLTKVGAAALAYVPVTADGVDRLALAVPAGAGLRLALGPLLPQQEYSVAMIVSMSGTSSYAKLLDTNDLAEDVGAKADIECRACHVVPRRRAGRLHRRFPRRRPRARRAAGRALRRKPRRRLPQRRLHSVQGLAARGAGDRRGRARGRLRRQLRCREDRPRQAARLQGQGGRQLTGGLAGMASSARCAWSGRRPFVSPHELEVESARARSWCASPTPSSPPARRR
jgi:hypothetical protein